MGCSTVWCSTVFMMKPHVLGVCNTGTGVSPELKSAIETYINENKVVVFIKGTKQFPQCGFSNTVVQVSWRHASSASPNGLHWRWPVLQKHHLCLCTALPAVRPIYPLPPSLADPEHHGRVL
jgi:hypothetical protein